MNGSDWRALLKEKGFLSAGKIVVPEGVKLGLHFRGDGRPRGFTVPHGMSSGTQEVEFNDRYLTVTTASYGSKSIEHYDWDDMFTFSVQTRL